ncbi:MAG: PLP-dependent aminotransferase family protein [Christensenellales bacterium]|jgi:2-aminoadipate transaminase
MIPFSVRMDKVTGSAIREIFALLARPGMISFAGGNPNPETFPSEDVAAITAELMATAGSRVLQYGGTAGMSSLCESVCALVGRKGISAKPEDVVILTGSSQGIDLIAKIFLNEGDAILTEAPTFLGALQTFRTYGAEPVGVAVDEEGMVMEDLEEKLKATRAKVIYTIPTFQNPTGRTMPLQRRQKMLELAKQYGAIILEDDPYGDLRYSGTPVPPIRSLDESGETVVYLGSFSKIISPGLRVGFAIGDSRILRKLIIAKQGADVHTSNLSQAIVDQIIRSGKLWPHIEACCAFYARQRDAMVNAIQTHLPKRVRYTVPDGGIFIWASLDEGENALELFQKSVEANVAFVPGEHFFPDLSGKNTFRLNFSMCSPDTIEEGMQRLGRLF